MRQKTITSQPDTYSTCSVVWPGLERAIQARTRHIHILFLQKSIQLPVWEMTFNTIDIIILLMSAINALLILIVLTERL